MTGAAYGEFTEDLAPCAIEWAHGYKMIDVVTLGTFVFQPVVLFKLLLFRIYWGALAEGIKVYYGIRKKRALFGTDYAVIAEAVRNGPCQYSGSSPAVSTIFGSVYVPYVVAGEQLGEGSYHFEEQGSGVDESGQPRRLAYIDYSQAQERLDNESRLPQKKYFEDGWAFDDATRVFTGTIDWSETPIKGNTRWDYRMEFSDDYRFIRGGEVRKFAVSGSARIGSAPIAFDEENDNKKYEELKFNDQLMYRNSSYRLDWSHEIHGNLIGRYLRYIFRRLPADEAITRYGFAQVSLTLS